MNCSLWWGKCNAFLTLVSYDFQNWVEMLLSRRNKRPAPLLFSFHSKETPCTPARAQNSFMASDSQTSRTCFIMLAGGAFSIFSSHVTDMKVPMHSGFSMSSGGKGTMLAVRCFMLDISAKVDPWIKSWFSVAKVSPVCCFIFRF